MKVYPAHDGRTLQINQASISSLGDLLPALSLLTGISEDSIICMTVTGEQLTEKVLEQILNSPKAADPDAEANTSIESRDGQEADDELELFVFNRDFLYDEPDELAHQLAQDPVLEPPVEEIDVTEPPTPKTLEALITWSQSLLRPLEMHHSQAQDSYSRLALMSRATSVALKNLLSHASSIEVAETELGQVASRELRRMEGLLDAHETDLNVLDMIPVNSKLLPNTITSSNQPLKPPNSGAPAVRTSSASTPPSATSSTATATPAKERTLGDYVSRVKMGAVASSCQRVYSELSSRLSSLEATLTQLKGDTSGLRSEVESTDIQPSYSTLEDSFSALERSRELISYIITTCSPDAQGWPAADYLSSTTPTSPGFLAFEKVLESLKELYLLDEVIRESYRRLNQDLNDMLVRSLHLLQDISALQSDYAEVALNLSALETDLKSNKLDGFKHLARLKNMLWAYGATVVECVRRKEFASHFLGKSQSLAELMAAVSSSERKRRASYRSDVVGQLPWEVKGLEEAPPSLEISTTRGAGERVPDLTRQDIESLIKLLDSVDDALISREQAQGQESTTEDASKALTIRPRPANPIPEIRATLQRLMEGLDDFNADFNELIDINLLGGAEDGEDSLEDSADESGEATDDEDSDVALRRRRRRRKERKAREQSEAQNQEARKALELAARLEREIEETKKATSERESRLARLHEAELQALRADLTIEKGKAEASIQEHQRERSTHLETRTAHETLKLNLENEVARRHNFEEEISHLRKEVEAARREMDEAKREAGEEVERVNELEAHLSDAQSELEDAKAAQADASGRIDALLSQGSSAEKELGAAQERIDDLNSQLATAKADIREARDALTESENARDKIMRSYRVEADSDRAILEENLRTQESELLAARADLKSRIELQTSLSEEVREQKETAELLRGQLRAADEAHEGIVRSAETAREAAAESENARSALEMTHQELLSLARPLLSSICELQKAAKAVPALSRSASATVPSNASSTSSENAQKQLQKKAAVEMYLASGGGASAEVTLEALRSVDPHAIQFEVKNKLESLTTLVRKWQKACKSSNEKVNKALISARERIQFRNFQVGDLGLFLPTRNLPANSTAAPNSASLIKPWAAFNIGFPHYFLRATGSLAEQLKAKDWIVARITQIEERISDSSKIASGDHFQLADGVRYYLLDVEGWTQPVSSSSSSNSVLRSKKSNLSQAKEADANGRNGGGPELKRRETLPSIASVGKDVFTSSSTRRYSARVASEGSQIAGGDHSRDTSGASIVGEGVDNSTSLSVTTEPEASTSLPLRSPDSPVDLQALLPTQTSIQSQRRSSVPLVAASTLSEPSSSSLRVSSNARPQSPGGVSVRSVGPSGIARALASSRATSPSSSRYSPGNGPPWSAASLDNPIPSSQIGANLNGGNATAPAFGKVKRRNNGDTTSTTGGRVPANALVTDQGSAADENGEKSSGSSTSTTRPLDAVQASHRLANAAAREHLGNPFSQSPAGPGVGSVGLSASGRGIEDYFSVKPRSADQTTPGDPSFASTNQPSQPTVAASKPSINPLAGTIESKSARRVGSSSSSSLHRAPTLLGLNASSLLMGQAPSSPSPRNGINIPSSSSSSSISTQRGLASPAPATASLIKAHGERSFSRSYSTSIGDDSLPSPPQRSAGYSPPTSTMTIGRAASKRVETKAAGRPVSPASPSFLSRTIGRMSSRKSIGNIEGLFPSSDASPANPSSSSYRSATGSREVSASSPTSHRSPSETSGFSNATGGAGGSSVGVGDGDSQSGHSGFTFHSTQESVSASSPRNTESASQMLRRLKGSSSSSKTLMSGVGGGSRNQARIQAHPAFTIKGKGKAKE